MEDLKEFKEKFFKLVDKVILSLMEDKDNFYGYFLFQMGREIRNRKNRKWRSR